MIGLTRSSRLITLLYKLIEGLEDESIYRKLRSRSVRHRLLRNVEKMSSSQAISIRSHTMSTTFSINGFFTQLLDLPDIKVETLRIFCKLWTDSAHVGQFNDSTVGLIHSERDGISRYQFD